MCIEPKLDKFLLVVKARAHKLSFGVKLFCKLSQSAREIVLGSVVSAYQSNRAEMLDYVLRRNMEWVHAETSDCIEENSELSYRV